MGYIYMLKNNINGLIYIGKTIDIKRRIKEYKYKSRKLDKRTSYKIMEEIYQFGFDNFSVSILEEVDNDILNEREIFWINELDARNPNIGYNSKTGGRGGSMTALSKHKMSESSKGFKHSEKEKIKRSKPIFVLHNGILIPKVSAKLHADAINKSRAEVTHAIRRGIKINGDYVFYQNTDLRKECFLTLSTKKNFIKSKYRLIYMIYFKDDFDDDECRD